MCRLQPNKSPFRKYRTFGRWIAIKKELSGQKKRAAGQLQIRSIIMIVSTTIKYHSIAEFHLRLVIVDGKRNNINNINHFSIWQSFHREFVHSCVFGKGSEWSRNCDVRGRKHNWNAFARSIIKPYDKGLNKMWFLNEMKMKESCLSMRKEFLRRWLKLRERQELGAFAIKTKPLDKLHNFYEDWISRRHIKISEFSCQSIIKPKTHRLVKMS